MHVRSQINKKQYLQLYQSRQIGYALPSMWVLVITQDKDGNPICAKSFILVLGNFEYRCYTKSQWHAPISKYNSLDLLCSKAEGNKHILQ